MGFGAVESVLACRHMAERLEYDAENGETVCNKPPGLDFQLRHSARLVWSHGATDCCMDRPRDEAQQQASGTTLRPIRDHALRHRNTANRFLISAQLVRRACTDRFTARLHASAECRGVAFAPMRDVVAGGGTVSKDT